MDIKAYIESGILEQYLLGMTSQTESQEVEGYASKYPQIRKELDLIETTLFKYASSFSITPPIGLKDRILNNIDDTSVPSSSKETQGIKKKSYFWEGVAFLSTILLAGLSLYHFNQTEKLNNENQKLENEYQLLKEECDTKSQKEIEINKNIAFLRDADTKPIRMKGTPLSPESEAVVYWNEESKSAYLDIAALPKPAQGKQYQLWAIVDGKPVDMGVFDLPASNGDFTEVPFIVEPQAFAVTLEPLGGVESPTMDQMYVIGEI